MKNILSFKKGDLIVRVVPAALTGGFNIFTGQPSGGDRSYIGDKLKFVGIANGCIYCKRTNEREIRAFGDELIDLPLDVWSDGWDYWIDPETLFESDQIINVSKDVLERQIQEAVNREDYETADRLRKQIENL